MSAAAAAPEVVTTAGGPPASPVATPATPSPAPAPTPAVPGPFDGLPVEIRGAPSLAKFKSVEDIAKSYLELETKIGAKGLIVPGKDAPQHEVDAFYMALGRPEKADGYAAAKFQPPEGLPWNNELLPKLLPKFHALGASDAMVSGIVEAYAEAQAEAAQGAMVQLQQEVAQGVQSLQREWGNAFDAKRDVAKRALVAFAGNLGDKIANIKLASGGVLGDHPDMLRWAANVGERMREDPLLGDATRRMTMTPDEASRELYKLENDPETRKILLDNMHQDHAAVMARRSALHKAKVGG